jgi:hypothetical protein
MARHHTRPGTRGARPERTGRRAVRRALAMTAVTALALTGIASAASAVAPPTPDLRFYAPTVTHSGVNGMNGDLKIGTTPVAGAAVVVQVGAAAGGPFSDVATTTTDSRGAYTFHVSVPATAFYRTSFAGNAAAAQAVSRVLQVQVTALPTSNAFHAPVAHAPGRTGMNGLVTGGWAKLGDPVVLQTSSSSTGPWTDTATTTVRDTYGDYTFYVNVPASAWYRTTYAGTSTSGPSTSVARYVTVIPGLLLFDTFSTGNSGAGDFFSTGPVRVSVSVVCGSRVFGGTNVKVFDTIHRLVPINAPLVPDTHITATGVIAPAGYHSLLVQSYCPGQITVRSQ